VASASGVWNVVLGVGVIASILLGLKGLGLFDRGLA
jgi:hypothetical protein